MTIRPVGDELLHADRLTMKLVVAFRNSANAAKNADRIRAIHSRTLQYGAVIATECRVSMVERLGKDELEGHERMWYDSKEVQYHPGKCVERMRKTEKP